MSGTYFGNEEDSNKEVLYCPTDTEDKQLQATKNLVVANIQQLKVTSLPPMKKVFISEYIGLLKLTEDKTPDANTSTNSTDKHWQRNFQPRVAHQPITSSLKKSGYRSGLNPQIKRLSSSLKRSGYRSGLNPQHKKTSKINKAKYYQTNQIFFRFGGG
jgi:hypothetical protein